MANKSLITERLKAINENKKGLKQEKPNVISNIADGEEKPDFDKMAEVLIGQEREEHKRFDALFTKDTIYIRNDLYKAMQALCVKKGDKKELVNQAYEEFLTRKYKELQQDLNL